MSADEKTCGTPKKGMVSEKPGGVWMVNNSEVYHVLDLWLKKTGPTRWTALS